MESKALTYEYLIRRAHQCARYGAAGADADTFRNFEKLSSSVAASGSDGSKKYNEYMFSAGKVCAYLKTAITFVLNTYESKLSNDQKTELEDVELLLSYPPTEAKIFEAIGRAEAVMLAIGLFPQ